MTRSEVPERVPIELASAILGVPARTVQALAARGEIPAAAKIGRRWTFDLAALQRFAKRSPVVKRYATKRTLKTSGSVVYFIRSGEQVKIGWTSDLPRRFSALQTSSARPLVLLATLPGGEKEERELHHRFRDDHIRAEWFTLSFQMKQFLRNGCGVPVE